MKKKHPKLVKLDFSNEKMVSRDVYIVGQKRNKVLDAIEIFFVDKYLWEGYKNNLSNGFKNANRVVEAEFRHNIRKITKL